MNADFTEKDKATIKEIDTAYTSRIAESRYMKPMGCGYTDIV